MNAPLAGLPNDQQSALLRACLFEGDEAQEAFAEWSDSIDLDRIDAASVRLLPLLADRLGSFGVADDSTGIYRGIQRQAWTHNQLLFRAARPLVQALHEAGIDSLLLKGAALSLAAYPKVSMRPMSDLDLLVPRAQAREAMATLLEAGWLPAFEPPRDRADFAVQHGLTFASPAGKDLQIDLHWRLFPWKSDVRAEDALWAHAVPLAALGENAKAMGAADMLLHVCAHGLRFNGLDPIRWVADAIMILRHCEIDWEHFVTQCDRFALALPIRAALDHLVVEMQADIPQHVRDRIAAMEVARIDRIIFAMDQIPRDSRSFTLYFQAHAYRAGAMVGKNPRALWRYVQRLRGDRSAGETLRWLWSRMQHRRDS